MLAYKSSCRKCGRVYFWAGIEAGGLDPADEIRAMRRARTVCIYCGRSGLETTHHHAFDGAFGLVGNHEARSNVGPAEVDDNVDPRYAEGRPPGQKTSEPTAPEPGEEIVLEVEIGDVIATFHDTLIAKGIEMDRETLPTWILPDVATDLELLWYVSAREAPEGELRLKLADEAFLDGHQEELEAGEFCGATIFELVLFLIKQLPEDLRKYAGRTIVAIGQPMTNIFDGPELAAFLAARFDDSGRPTVFFVEGHQQQADWLYLCVRLET